MDKFYTKDFTRRTFYETVKAIALGDEVSEPVLHLVYNAAEYELNRMDDKLAKDREKRGQSEKPDPLGSEYAQALVTALRPHLTSEPKTLAQLSQAMVDAGSYAPSGKVFSTPWIGRVLKQLDGVQITTKVIDTVDKKGLKVQKEVQAYSVY